MLFFYVLTFFKKEDTIQGGTLFKEIQYVVPNIYVWLYVDKEVFYRGLMAKNREPTFQIHDLKSVFND